MSFYVRYVRSKTAVTRGLADAVPSLFTALHCRQLRRSRGGFALRGLDDSARAAAEECVVRARERIGDEGGRVRLAIALTLLAPHLTDDAATKAALDEAMVIFNETPKRTPKIVQREIAAKLENAGISARSGAEADALRIVDECLAELVGPNVASSYGKHLSARCHLKRYAVLKQLDRRDEAIDAGKAALSAFSKIPLRRRMALGKTMLELRRSTAEMLRLAGQLDECLALIEQMGAVENAAGAPYNPNAHFMRASIDLERALACDEKRDYEQGAKAASLALSYLRDAKGNAPAVRANTALALLTLSAAQAEIGEEAKAVESQRECAEIYGELADVDPQKYVERHAGALRTLADRLRTADSAVDEALTSETVAAYQRAVDVQRDHDALPSDLRDLLIDLCIALHDAGRNADAVAPAGECVAISRESGEGDDLGWDLWRLGHYQRSAELNADAIATLREAERLLMDSETVSGHGLVRAHRDLVYALQSARRYEELIPPATRSIDFIGSLREPDEGVICLRGELLHARAKAQHHLGAHRHALADITQAHEIAEGLDSRDAGWMAKLVSERGALCAHLGEFDLAVSDAGELVHLARAYPEIGDADALLDYIYQTEPEAFAAAWLRLTGSSWPPRLPDKSTSF